MSSRTTRSGAKFSPYRFELAEPLKAPSTFSVNKYLACLAADDEETASDHDVEVDNGPESALDADPAPSASLVEHNPPNIARPPGITKNQWSTMKKRSKRGVKRAESQASSGSTIKECSRKYQKRAAPYAMLSTLEAKSDLAKHVTLPAWIGRKEAEQDWSVYGLAELEGKYNMKRVDWNGIDTVPLIDCDRRVFGLLGGMPKDHDWDDVQKQGASGMDQARCQLQVPAKFQHHRRGHFPALSLGISHGGGRELPARVVNTDKNTPILNELAQMPAFRRISGHTSRLFEAFAPRLYKEYSTTLNNILTDSPDLVKLYDNSVFAAATFNLGPQTVSYPHRDWANLSWGWCAITALGSYNPDLGGHLVLWDLGYIIRFPPGSTIFIPSALIRHSNTPVSEGETRYSFAQYSAGGLFRWEDNGYMKNSEWLAKAGPREKDEKEEQRKVRWSEGLKKLSYLDEFV